MDLSLFSFSYCMYVSFTYLSLSFPSIYACIQPSVVCYLPQLQVSVGSHPLLPQALTSLSSSPAHSFGLQVDKGHLHPKIITKMIINQHCPKYKLIYQVDPVTVFAPSNAAFARANADGWVGNLASLRHLLLRHLVRWECLVSLSTIMI